MFKRIFYAARRRILWKQLLTTDKNLIFGSTALHDWLHRRPLTVPRLCIWFVASIEILSKSCEEALRHGGVPQWQKNSYPELYFLQSCACKKEENEDLNMSERMNIGHVSTAAAKVYIEAFLFGVKENRKTWVIGLTGCSLLVRHFPGMSGRNLAGLSNRLHRYYDGQKRTKRWPPSGKRGGEHKWSHVWKDVLLWKWNMSAQQQRWFGKLSFPSIANLLYL